MKLMVLVLAAGKGTRMKSSTPKVLFPAAGKPMIDYVLDSAILLSPASVRVVIGSGADEVSAHLSDRGVKTVVQETQQGTADAVLAAKREIEEFDGRVLILCGDMPLVDTATLRSFLAATEQADVAFISTVMDKPAGYGRIVRGMDGQVQKIVEEKDADERTRKITEINTGIYAAKADVLLKRLDGISNDNAQNEYYLTDIVKNGSTAYKVNDAKEFIGVNDRAALSTVSKMLWKKRANAFMMGGVSILDPDAVYIDESVTIEPDVTIHPGVTIEGHTVIKSGTVIYPGNRIADATIEEDCEIRDNCLITESRVGKKSVIGPMAHLRPGTDLMGGNRIGNFVETKKIFMGAGSKASHLTYLGDAEIGTGCNIGCGTITCNYDGISKHKTTLGDDVFIGSDVQLVAPVTVGTGALVAAGSTITKDVPPGALGITRAVQKNLDGWVERWKASKKKDKE